MRTISTGLVALFSVFAALGSLPGCSKSDADPAAAQRRPAVPVRAATAVEKDVPIQLRAIGTVEAYASVDVKSRVDGQVSEVHFREGQEVRKGDLLFSIDARPFEAALRQAEANYERRRAEAQNARVEAQRLTQLLAQQIVSQDEYDQAQTQAAAMGSTVDAERAAVDNAKLQLLYCRITSPIDGRIGRILVNLGNIVKSDETTLAVVNQIRPIYVRFSVPQQTLPTIRDHSEGVPLRVDAVADAAQGKVVSGELSFIDNQVNTDSGTVLLKGLFTNAHEELWPGQFVDTLLTLSTQSRAVVIPSAAVQTGQQGPYVFVIDANHTVELRTVRTGEDLGEEMVIDENLRAGERVVTDGHFLIAPGMTVEVKETAAEAPPVTPVSPAG
jgi:multidrug efflux system membrane fusion protein